MVTAVSGMALTVVWPTTAAVTAEGGAQDGVLAEAHEAVHAPDSAAVQFDRAALSSILDPDVRLRGIVAAAGNDVAPAAAKGSLSAPMDDLRETSPFGTRTSPITGEAGEMHSGQDFASSCGTRVLAAADGTVSFAGWHPFGGGFRVVIDHVGGLQTTYSHLSVITVGEGQVIRRGDKVAESGSTGASTGCHLHFEVMVDGETVDPLAWL